MLAVKLEKVFVLGVTFSNFANSGKRQVSDETWEQLDVWSVFGRLTKVFKWCGSILEVFLV